MIPKFKLITIDGVKQFVVRSPVDWPNVGVWATCGAFIGLTLVGLAMELTR